MSSPPRSVNAQPLDARDESVVSLSSLCAGGEASETSRQTLVRHLARRGFALIKVDQPRRVSALSAGLDRAGSLAGFRFPPINVDQVRYSEVERAAFHALYASAIDCLSALSQTCQIDEAHDSSEGLHPELFSVSPDEPFPLGHPFHPTFFNLFNYDHGALNEHKDRGLLTVICIRPAPHKAGREASVLWVEGADRVWRSVDHAVLDAQEAHRRADQTTPSPLIITLLVGEDGEERFSEVELDSGASNPQSTSAISALYAAEHSVRVSPEGPYIERSHYLRDPSSRAEHNRLSAALILKRLDSSGETSLSC